MSSLVRLSCLMLLAGMILPGSGCAQLDLTESIPWATGSEDKPGVPIKVVAMWKDTVLYQSNRPPTRGFGGRLMFYDVKGEKPIKVDGKLVVYAFDERGRRPGDVKPDRKFVFTKEQLVQHYSESDLGHSYSVWLPWDEVGGYEKEISLIVRFVPEQGPAVPSEQTRHILPGPKPPEETQVANDRPGIPAGGTSTAATTNGRDHRQPVQLASHEAPATPGGSVVNANCNDLRMTTTTISIPPRFARQVAEAGVEREATATARSAEAHWPVAAYPVGAPAQAYPVQSTGYPPAAGQVPPQAYPSAGPVQDYCPPPQPPAHFSPSRPRPRAMPFVRQGPDRVQWPRGPAASPFRQSASPPTATSYAAPTSSPTGWTTRY